jgi:hypothetical protein
MKTYLPWKFAIKKIIQLRILHPLQLKKLPMLQTLNFTSRPSDVVDEVTETGKPVAFEL